jgi:hypothetical protein
MAVDENSHYFFTAGTELGANCWDQYFLFFENHVKVINTSTACPHIRLRELHR